MTAPPAAPAAGQAPFPDPIEHLMPFGSISTLSGAAGVGKTAFTASMVLAWQRGDDLFGFKTTIPPAIGMLVADRPWRDHQRWFEKAGCQPFAHYSPWDEDYQWEVLRDHKALPKTLGGWIDSLKLPPGALLIIDPISIFIPGRLFDYRDVAVGLGLLGQQFRLRQLTVLGIFHIGKQKSSANDRYLRPQDRILGSTALLGYSETAFYLASPEESQRRTYEFGIIPHQIKATALQYTRNEQGLFVPAEFFDDVHEQEAAYDLLPNDGSSLATSVWQFKIQQLLKISLRSAERIMRDLRRAGRVVKAGQGKYRRALPQ